MLRLQELTVLVLLNVIVDKFYQAVLVRNVQVVGLNQSFEERFGHAHDKTVLILEDLIEFADDHSLAGRLQLRVFKFNSVLVEMRHILIAQ